MRISSEPHTLLKDLTSKVYLLPSKLLRQQSHTGLGHLRIGSCTGPVLQSGLVLQCIANIELLGIGKVPWCIGRPRIDLVLPELEEPLNTGLVLLKLW